MNDTKTINDPIYGKVTIAEPVLIELINAKPLQRLKQIHQLGANYFFWPEQTMRSRFEHSVGVMLLLKKLGSPFQEQVAGLLHDVAHSAFSHVLDYLIENREHEAHQLRTEQYIVTTEVPQILKNHKFDWRKIFDHHRFGLLEQPSPALCADRLDYFLRDAIGYGVLNIEEAKKILKKLAVHKNKIVTTDRAVAKLIGEKYLEMDREFWATSRNALGINYALVEIIRRAIGLGLFSIEDLWRLTDEQVIDKLKALDDPVINEWFELINPQAIIIEDRNRYDVHVYPKIRLIDPEVLENGKVLCLSQLDLDFADQLSAAREFPEELFLRFH